MNLDSLSFALSQISYSVANLTKKNFKSSVQELSHLVAQHGLEADRHLLRCIFSHVDFSGDGKSSGKDFHQTQYLIQECASLIAKPNFVSNLCYAVDYPLHHQKSLKPSAQLLSQLSKVLKLTKVQEVAFGIALLYSSNADTKTYAAQFLKQKLCDLLKFFCDQDSTSNQEDSLQQLPAEVLHLILTHTLYSINEQLQFTSEQKSSFLKALHKEFPRHQVPAVLLPLLYPDKQDIPMDKIVQDSPSMVNNMLEVSLSDMIMEVGYNFCASLEDCRAHLLQLGVRELTAAIVARILGMMGRTHTGLGEQVAIQSLQNASSIWSDNKEKTESSQANTWNVDIFVQVVQEMAPKLNWKEVVYGLDHSGFILKDRLGLKLLTQALQLGLGHEPFPVELLFRLWKNNEGQLSYIQQILKHPDILCLADYCTRNIVTDVLKAQPEEDSREISNWKSLGLLEVLLCLADAGHYSQVHEMMKFPIQHCSDVLTLGLLQINQPITMLRQDLLTTLIPIFLGNHPNSAIILQYAWHTQNQTNSIRSIVMHVMAEWYMRGEHDQTRLSRILDVAQDLKALSLLLNAPTFPFVIDLACLASRREYLKLDKWLSDKIREHGESFVQDCVSFLKRRCPQIMGATLKEENLPKSAQLPTETLTTMLACLQACTGSVSQELSETIVTMFGNCTILLNNARQPPPGVVKQPRGLEHVFSQALNSPLVSTQLVDPLAGLIPGITVGSATSNNFPLPGTLSNLPTPGSPAKMFSSSASVTQSAFSSIVPPLTSQLPGQLGVNTNTILSSGFGSVGSKASYGPPQGVDRLRQDMSTLFPEVSPAEASEVEDEANSYFKRIYSHPSHPTLSIDEVLDMLKRFQDSANRRERDVFNCMLRNLYEEYRFFPQYPDKELYITAQLFGGLIERGLITYILLGIALRYVLDALRKPVGSKMYYFGIAALDRFKNRLKDYPQYCQHLASIPHFQEFPPHLIEYIEYGSRSQEPPNKPQGPVLPPTVTAVVPTPVCSVVKTITSTTVTTTAAVSKPATILTHNGKPSIANATNIDTLLVATEKDDKIAVPPEAVQDKIAFIFNNLSQANIVQKIEELKEVVTDDYWPWVAQYLVMKRASIEANFHTLYANFMDTLKMPDFNNYVVKETFRNIKVLLQSDKSIANFSDRSLLKNLGHWLGMVTLGKNKPILQIEIDIKSLLIEAYHKGLQELLYVVPFVGKVLESCAKSKVFKPPNPWTIGIMNLLAELHQEQDLKLNLKFEIEVLCKTLSIDINELKPSLIIRDQERFNRIEHQLSQPQKKQELTAAVEEQPPPSNVISSSTPTMMSAVATTQAAVPVGPPEPRFAYDDISASSIAAISQLVVISNQITLFQANPQLKTYVRPAIERAVQEWVHVVVDRSIKIALTTCEQIVKKDFALDPEESRMRAAAHYMVRNLTAGMAMITCRDHLLMSINNNLKAAFASALRSGSIQPKDLIEQAATVIAQDNVELACAFIQRTAVEKALPEIDKRLATEFEFRKHARNEGRRYCDPTVLTYQAERMPEQIRLKVGGVTPQQMAVYEEFARNIPGFLPSNEREHLGFISKQSSSYGSDEIVHIYDKIASELESYIQSCMAPPSNPQVAGLHSLLESVILARNSREIVTALALLQKAVEGLLEGLLPLSNDTDLAIKFRDGHLLVLKALQESRAYGPQWTNKQVTRCLMECREEYKYNIEAVDCLIRSHLVNMPQYDQHLALSLENGVNFIAIQFAMQLLRLYLIEERHSSPVTEADLINVIEALARIHMQSRPSPDGLPQLLDMIRANNDPGLLDRAPGGPTSMIVSHVPQQRQFDDPPGLHDKTTFLLRQWVDLYHSPNPINLSFTKFVQQMNMHGILKTDDLITRFFRLCVEMCVDLCYQTLAEQNATPTLVRSKCFHTLDAFVRLIALLVKHSGDSANTVTKINLLNKVLSIVTSVLLNDHEMRHTEFQQLPYHRIFIMLLLELNAPENVLEIINFQVLNAFCNTFHVLNPSKAPGFAYAWLELISHRVFVGRMLVLTPQQKGWGIYSKLLIDLFKFLAPFLRNAELLKPVGVLYKGTLRLLLVLLHDFPEFLCDYHYGFCDVIPPNCIQMRNLILSAFPRNMRLPDPFTPNLKVDMLPEIAHAPRVLTNFASMIQPPNFKKDLDSYIKTRAPVTFLSELRSNLQVSNEPGVRYNIPLINALVLYVGTQAISYIHSKGSTPSMSTITHSSHMDIFQNLAVDLDTEGRYLFLNAIANQLRYPNSHTHYFSCTLLYLFVEANTEAIQEQITRVLLERLIVNRPHPWGLLITFIELIKNPHFKFWNHEFVHCAPEIEKLLESVARSCITPKQVEVLSK